MEPIRTLQEVAGIESKITDKKTKAKSIKKTFKTTNCKLAVFFKYLTKFRLLFVNFLLKDNLGIKVLETLNRVFKCPF